MRYRITPYIGTVVFAGLLAISLPEPASACGNGDFLSQITCEFFPNMLDPRHLGTPHPSLGAPLEAVLFDLPKYAVPFHFQTQVQPLGDSRESFGVLLPVDLTQAVDPMEAGKPIDIIQLNPLLPSCDDNPHWLGCSSWN